MKTLFPLTHRSWLVLPMALFFLGAANAFSQTIDFEQGTTYSAYPFRTLNGTDPVIATYPGTNHAVAQGNSTTNTLLVYDANGSTAGQSTFTGSVTVSFSFAMKGTNDSVGVFFLNPAESASGTTDAVMALFNADFSGTAGTNDEMRVFTGNPLDGLTASQQGSTTTGDAYTTSTTAVMQTATVTYTGGTAPTLTMTIGSMTKSVTLASGILVDPYEIGFRIGNNVGGTYLDNIVVTAAPEPSPALLVPAGGLILLLLTARLRNRLSVF